MKKVIGALMASAIVLATSGGVAHAATGQMVDLDVQGSTYDGSGPVLTNGADYYMYSISSATGETNKPIPLVEASGSSTNARLAYTADASTAINTALGMSTTMAATPYVLLFDGYMNSDSVGSITFSRLDASKNYEMVVYAQREVGQATSLKINGTQVITNASNLSALTQATAANSLNGNYAYISGLTSNSSGVLSFTYQGQISGLQIKELPAAVPEPASVMLLGVGGLLGAYRMRKTRENEAA
ncbi:MAG: PEP-CTERM sorting domain-containing protein [Chlorobaculum sp.]|nr:PEP-CTERM sorting domain-containing protein [Chlorobaculum sp.]